jgi:hypothetical protein
MSEWRAAHAHDARLEVVKAAKNFVQMTKQKDPEGEAEFLRELVQAVEEGSAAGQHDWNVVRRVTVAVRHPRPIHHRHVIKQRPVAVSRRLETEFSRVGGDFLIRLPGSSLVGRSQKRGVALIGS